MLKTDAIQTKRESGNRKPENEMGEILSSSCRAIRPGNQGAVFCTAAHPCGCFSEEDYNSNEQKLLVFSASPHASIKMVILLYEGVRVRMKKGIFTDLNPRIFKPKEECS